ncbi:MAG: hypothetical protein ACXAEU_08070 [Candidatus Hodarchaeales archaeon]|jgi:hypothetical protein
MSKPEIVFSVFDDSLGPIPILSTKEEDEEFGQIIAFKSQLTLSLAFISDEIKNAEAVLPFPEIGKIAYAFLFGVRTTGNSSKRHAECVASLSYVVEKSEQMNFYQKIPLLKKQASRIAEVLREEYQYEGKDQVLSEKLKDHIKSFGAWKALENGMKALENDYATRKIKIRRSNVGSFGYLVATIKKGIDGIVYSLIVDKPVIVIGDKTSTSQLIGSLEILVPHKFVRKIEHSMIYINPREADIIGVNEELSRYYSTKDYVVINLRKGKAEGPYKSKYIQDVFKGLKKLDDEQEAIKVIENEISKALSSANHLVEICNVPNPSKEKINNFKKQVPPDIFDLIIAIATSYNPVIAEHVKRNVTEAYTDWLRDL